MKIYPKAIKRMLDIKLLTQSDFAEKTGISRATISNILHKGSCNVNTARKICEALGVDPTEIIEKDDE